MDESSQSETGAETDHAEIPEGQNADQSEGENVEKAEDPDSDSETQTALSPQGTFNDKDIVNSESGITRGEWMHNLAVMFELTTDNDGVSDAYYPDLTTSTQYFKDIWAVIDAGAVALEPGKNLRAGDSLTRDFAAATLNYFLGYQMEGSSYSFSDSADCTDPGSAQVAVNRGWFALSGGKFLPNQAVTSAEVIAMTKDAKQALKESTISAGGNSQYTFADNVVVFPKGVSLSFNEDNSVVTIGDTTTSVSKGDTFVVWLTSDLPGIYRADSVNKTGGNQIISISDADVDNALLDVNASGSMDVDLSTFEGADVVKINRFVSGRLDTLAVASGLITQAAGDVTITVGSVSASAGKTVSIPVNISGNSGIAGMALEFNIPSGMKLNSITAGDVLKDGAFTQNGNIITWYTTDNVYRDGVILKLNVTVPESSGSYTVRAALKDGKASNLSNESSNSVGVSFEAGTVNVSGGATSTLAKTKLSSVKFDKKKKIVTVKWKKNTKGKGYEVEYSTDKKFKKSVKTVKISKNKTVKTTVKKLKKGTWYFRIRTVKGKKYSGWSTVKKVKVTK